MTWRELASCRGRGPTDGTRQRHKWFPAQHEQPDPEALAICSSCPVRLPCAEEAAATGAQGLWGGRLRTSTTRRFASPVSEQRTCACGCGETFTAPENSPRRYVDKRHADVGRDRRGRRRAG